MTTVATPRKWPGRNRPQRWSATRPTSTTQSSGAGIHLRHRRREHHVNACRGGAEVSIGLQRARIALEVLRPVELQGLTKMLTMTTSHSRAREVDETRVARVQARPSSEQADPRPARASPRPGSGRVRPPARRARHSIPQARDRRRSLPADSSQAVGVAGLRGGRPCVASGLRRRRRMPARTTSRFPSRCAYCLTNDGTWTVEEADHVVGHEHLPVAIRPRADADGGDRERPGHRRARRRRESPRARSQMRRPLRARARRQAATSASRGVVAWRTKSTDLMRRTAGAGRGVPSPGCRRQRGA